MGRVSKGGQEIGYIIEIEQMKENGTKFLIVQEGQNKMDWKVGVILWSWFSLT